MGANVRVVTLRNTVHVTSEGDNYLIEGMRCARTVIRSFLRGALKRVCADAIPNRKQSTKWPFWHPRRVMKGPR